MEEILVWWRLKTTIIPSAPKSSSRHFIFHRKCVSLEWYFYSVFYPSKQKHARDCDLGDSGRDTAFDLKTEQCACLFSWVVSCITCTSAFLRNWKNGVQWPIRTTRKKGHPEGGWERRLCSQGSGSGVINRERLQSIVPTCYLFNSEFYNTNV